MREYVPGTNLLLRGAGAFPDSFLRRLADAEPASEAASASGALWQIWVLDVDVEPMGGPKLIH